MNVSKFNISGAFNETAGGINGSAHHVEAHVIYIIGGVSLFLFCLLIIIIKQYCPAPLQEEEDQARLKILEIRNIENQFETLDGIDADSNSGDLNSKTDYRQKLVSFFESKDPSRVVAVDALLEEYTGKEDHLLVMLSKEYEKKDLKTQQLRTEVDAAI